MAADAASAAVKNLTLKSSDDEVFVVDVAVAMASQTIKHLVDDGCADNIIPLPNVSANILIKVIDYCKQHVLNGDAAAAAADSSSTSTSVKPDEVNLKAFDEHFVKVDQTVLFDLILAANYLEIKGLLDLTCQTVADMIKGKTPEEIRKTFNIVNDFTPQEEEEIRRENQWAFE
ncbi:SKP1-like protein 1B [Hordeum vulgare]|uniref:SKP1-like protein n=1 Tax=Hordeum vulgare subsp. vulgare TaxID=112509 RepID=A0A8I7BF26_HORVV|nr:SKP1-like protein 1 [Hordeum vulgare subsp. vulgare]KAE8783518.1 SKP1-like protein 1B [Hordeum vulgare]KAI4989352.1 hypothetical protein ZWY2020_036669 [Hordeum vulgare]